MMNEYIRDFHRIDKDKNGFLTSKEVKRSWQDKGYNLSDDAVKNVIEVFDLNSDKKISLNGILIVIFVKSPSFPKSILSLILEYLDVLTFKHLEVSLSIEEVFKYTNFLFILLNAVIIHF